MAQPLSVKKSIVSNPKYQQRFVPLFLKAESEIKKTIVAYWWLGKSKNQLLQKIRAIVNKLSKDFPIDITDREVYINGIFASANKMIKTIYEKAVYDFTIAKTELTNIFLTSGIRVPNMATPQKLSKLIQAKLNNRQVWAEAKGVPYVADYQKKVIKLVKELAQAPTTTADKGHKAISLIQKAELQTRYDTQMENLQELVDKGVEYAYLSSHVNCSKRCEAWQGELVSLTERAKNPQTNVKNYKYNKSSYLVKKLNGINVYSLKDITETTNEYGYKNNIYNGFNCRHKLIPYKKGETPPTDYDAKRIKKQRQVEARIREMEREIIALKEERNGLLAINDEKGSDLLKVKIDSKIAYYKRFCEANGYAWSPMRIGNGIL